MRHLLILPFKLLWYAVVLAMPLLGFWLASTLALFLNGPRWLPWLAGGLSLLLPLLWELERQSRFGRRKAEREAKQQPAPTQLLKPSDRLVLRTLFLNLVFLTALLIVWPQTSFAALATRGDWMLEGRQGAWVERSRTFLFSAANRLEWLYAFSQQNPYARMAEDQTGAADPALAHTPIPGELNTELTPMDESDSEREPESDLTDQIQSPQAETGESLQADTVTAGSAPSWPLDRKLHPVITALQAPQEHSIAAVATYIGQQESDPYRRVKAIYDYLASRISYDAESLAVGLYPPQDAETVFKTRKGVCAGYANLFKALAEELGIQAAFVVGDSRDLEGRIAGSSHAWNAVEIGGKWYLLDATWGAGYVENFTFNRRYNPAYLMTPPEIFAMDHLPEETHWQLRRPALDRGEFARQPLLRASFFEKGYQLISPQRSQISVSDQVELQLQNSQNQHLMVRLSPEQGGSATACAVSGRQAIRVNCQIPGPGRYKVMLFSNQQASGQFEYVGQVSVVSG